MGSHFRTLHDKHLISYTDIGGKNVYVIQTTFSLQYFKAFLDDETPGSNDDDKKSKTFEGENIENVVDYKSIVSNKSKVKRSTIIGLVCLVASIACSLTLLILLKKNEPTTSLKCYLGTPQDPKLTDCGATGDLCTNSTLNGVVSWVCGNKVAMDTVDTDLAKGGCKVVKGLQIKVCVCNTDGCNSASAQSSIQIVT